jgi:thiol-disulfide isomerase/thioredoxin
MKHSNNTTLSCVAAVLVATGCSDRDRPARYSAHEQEHSTESLVQTDWLSDSQRLGDELPPWLKAAQSGELLQLTDESVIEETLSSTSLAFLLFTAWSKDQRLGKSDGDVIYLLAEYSRLHRLPMFEVPFEFFTHSGQMAWERFGVRAAPMVLVFLHGEEIGRLASAPPARDSLLGFEQEVEEILIRAGASFPDRRVTVTEANHEAFVSEEGTVLLFFTAPWCTACKPYYPNVRNLSVKAPGLRVGVINVDESANLAKERYNVRGIPAFVVLENGVEKGRALGGLNAADLVYDLYPIGKPLVQHDTGKREESE